MRLDCQGASTHAPQNARRTRLARFREPIEEAWGATGSCARSSIGLSLAIAVGMKASFFSLVPVVLGLSFSNVALAEEPPAADSAPAADAAVAEEAPQAEPILIQQPAVEAERPGPVAEPMPEAPAKAKPVGKVKSPAMIIVGSILSGVGAANIIAGGVLMAQAEAQNCDVGNDAFGLGAAFCGMGQGFDKAIATALLISGGVHSAVGIPLIAVGSQAPNKTKDEAPAPRADLQITATGATFTMSF